MTEIPMSAAPPSPPADRRVDVWFSGLASQHRLTVLFRLVLAVPQLFVVSVLVLAAYVVEVIGWFGALSMGRFPRWAHEFVSGVVRWETRVQAYMLLLTDRYPPFSLEDEEFPVRVFVSGPGRLNRWTVLFRIVLVIPAALFAQIVISGLTIPLLVVVWVIVLVRGGMPDPLYGAVRGAAALRHPPELVLRDADVGVPLGHARRPGVVGT